MGEFAGMIRMRGEEGHCSKFYQRRKLFEADRRWGEGVGGDIAKKVLLHCLLTEKKQRNAILILHV